MISAYNVGGGVIDGQLGAEEVRATGMARTILPFLLPFSP